MLPLQPVEARMVYWDRLLTATSFLIVVWVFTLTSSLGGETITATGMAPQEGTGRETAWNLAKNHALQLATEKYCSTHLTGLRLTASGLIEKYLSPLAAPAPLATKVVSEEVQGNLLKVTISARFPSPPDLLDFPPVTWKNLRVTIHTEEKFVTREKIFMEAGLKRYLVAYFTRRGAETYPLGAPPGSNLLEEARKKGTHFLVLLKEVTKKISENAAAGTFLSTGTLWWYDVPAGLRVYSQKISATGHPDVDDHLALKNSSDSMNLQLGATLDGLLGPELPPGTTPPAPASPSVPSASPAPAAKPSAPTQK